MATKIVTKNSSTASAVPTASDLVQGELAVNVADKRLFTEDNGGSIVELGTNPSTIDINAGTIDGTAIGASSASTGAFTTLTATGLDVTGTATMDGLTVDGTGDGVKATIGKTGGTNLNIYADTNTVYLAGSSALSTAYIIDQTNNNMQFKVNAAERMRIDSSGNVGIGTTSPDAPLTLNGSSSSRLNMRAGDTRYGTLFADSGVFAVASIGSTPLVLGTNDTERMRIDSSGNVGIGTSSPTSISGYTALEINNATSGALLDLSQGDSMRGRLIATATTMSLETSGSIPIIFQPTGVEAMRIDSSGNVGIGTSSPSAKMHLESTSGNQLRVAYNSSFYWDIEREASTGSLTFTDDTAGEVMRLDGDGNLLVGTTDSNVYNDATGTGTVIQSNGIMQLAANNGTPLYVNRQGNDGQIIDFRKAGSTVGSVGTRASQLSIGSADTGLEFNNANDAVIPFNSSTNSGRDNAIDLGISSVRFDDIYATNGTIQTSDRNEKQDIAELSDAEQRVAVAAKGLLRKFRWKDSVAEKGDDARIHFGIIAQDLQAAFEAEGLDAGDYAMFISTTWTDEETNEEKTRMGVRYSELLAFIISAI